MVDAVYEPSEGQWLDVGHVVLEFGLGLAPLLVDDVVGAVGEGRVEGGVEGHGALRGGDGLRIGLPEEQLAAPSLDEHLELPPAGTVASELPVEVHVATAQQSRQLHNNNNNLYFIKNWYITKYNYNKYNYINIIILKVQVATAQQSRQLHNNNNLYFIKNWYITKYNYNKYNYINIIILNIIILKVHVATAQQSRQLHNNNNNLYLNYSLSLFIFINIFIFMIFIYLYQKLIYNKI